MQAGVRFNHGEMAMAWGKEGKHSSSGRWIENCMATSKAGKLYNWLPIESLISLSLYLFLRLRWNKMWRKEGGCEGRHLGREVFESWQTSKEWGWCSPGPTAWMVRGVGKKDGMAMPFWGEKGEKRPGSLRHQWKEEKGLATFEGRKIALLKVMRAKDILSFKMEMRTKWDALCCKDARLCIKATHTNSSLVFPFPLSLSLLCHLLLVLLLLQRLDYPREREAVFFSLSPSIRIP